MSGQQFLCFGQQGYNVYMYIYCVSVIYVGDTSLRASQQRKHTTVVSFGFGATVLGPSPALQGFEANCCISQTCWSGFVLRRQNGRAFQRGCSLSIHSRPKHASVTSSSKSSKCRFVQLVGHVNVRTLSHVTAPAKQNVWQPNCPSMTYPYVVSESSGGEAVDRSK